MELQLKYHKNICDKFLSDNLHIFKVTSWLPYQLTLLKSVCLNQDKHVTWRQQLFSGKVMENLHGMCSYIAFFKLQIYIRKHA